MYMGCGDGNGRGNDYSAWTEGTGGAYANAGTKELTCLDLNVELNR